MTDLSILIPARNEMFLAKTIENILANIRGDTEVIAVLDGIWAEPPIPQNPRVSIIYHNHSIGQRAATNEAARLSKAKYLMKCDAHCAFDEGFDVKMMREMHDDWTMVPLMKNLHAFDWVCPDGHRRYQGPSGPCLECGKETTRDVLWEAKPSPNSVSYCFDSTPHFQYFGEYPKRPEGKGDIAETMSLQGSCWMLTRSKYWELNVCDENFGSWGSQGIEVAVKTWLSGGRVMVNKKTWYAHMFRTQGGDFGFPYPITGRDQENAKKFAKDLFFNDKWPLQKRPLSWLVERFWPVKGWTDEDLAKLKANTFRFSENVEIKAAESEPMAEVIEESKDKVIYDLNSPTSGIVFINSEPILSKGIVYYTNNQLNLRVAHAAQRQLAKTAGRMNIPIVSVSLKPMNFGFNLYLPLKAGYLTMLKQIQMGIANSKADIIYLCANNVLYHPSHFSFNPDKKDFCYYNSNVWELNPKDLRGVKSGEWNLSGLAAYKETLSDYFDSLIKKAETEKLADDTEFDPGSHQSQAWESDFPNIDLQTDKSFEGTVDSLPDWGKVSELVKGIR